jgi:hypothetical protein
MTDWIPLPHPFYLLKADGREFNVTAFVQEATRPKYLTTTGHTVYLETNDYTSTIVRDDETLDAD